MQSLIAALANHLWQSTVFLAAVAAACLLLRHHSPRLRYWMWLAASLKFLIPFSVLVSLGAVFERPPESLPAIQARTVAQVSYAFATAPASMVGADAQTATAAWPTILLCLWAAGFVGVAAYRLRQWRSLLAVRRRGQRVPFAFPVPAVEADTLIEPGIFGIVRPVLLLPAGLRGELTGEQLAVLVEHELCHLRYRDNVTAAMHMTVEALFWFYPPVWWIGAKLVAERERACDQSVLARGGSAEVYAASLLSVCRRYLESPLPCVPGVTGSDLKTRIHDIMTGRTGRPLGAARKAALALAALVAVSLPVAIGVLRGQGPPPEYTYDTVSVRPADPDGGRMGLISDPQGNIRGQNVTAMMLLTFAFDVPASQLAQVPEWVISERFDVTFTPKRRENLKDRRVPRDQMEGLMSRQRERMQAVLRDRFGLVMGSESRGRLLYSLSVAQGGSKLTANDDPKPVMRLRQGQVTAKAATMTMLTRFLSAQLGRPVVDQTGLEGGFDFTIEWTPDRPLMAPNGTPVRAGSGRPPLVGGAGRPAMAAALREQLGLELESRNESAPVLVVEKIERPEAN